METIRQFLDSLDPSTGTGAFLLGVALVFVQFIVGEIVATRMPQAWKVRIVRSDAIIGALIGLWVALWLHTLTALATLPVLYAFAAVGIRYLGTRAVLAHKKNETDRQLLTERAEAERKAIVRDLPVLLPQRVLVQEVETQDYRDRSGVEVEICASNPIGFRFTNYDSTGEYWVHCYIREVFGEPIKFQGAETAALYLPPMIVLGRVCGRASLSFKDQALVRLCNLTVLSAKETWRAITLTAFSSMKTFDAEHRLVEIWCEGDEHPGRAILDVHIIRQDDKGTCRVKELRYAIEALDYGDPRIRELDISVPLPLSGVAYLPGEGDDERDV